MGAGDFLVPWGVLLLPYVEQDGLWTQTQNAFRTAPQGYMNPPHVGLATVVKVYACPADGRLSAPITDDQGFRAAYGSYVGVNGGKTGGDGCMLLGGDVSLADILDGTSQKLLIGELPPPGRLLAGSWYTHDMADRSWMFDSYYIGGRRGTLTASWPWDVGGCRGPFHFGPGPIDNPCDCNHFWSLHSGGANFVLADSSARFISYGAVDILPALATRAGGEAVQLP